MSDSLPLVLVDGSSFLYRAFFGSKQNFTNSKGIPTAAALIITRMLQGLLKKFEGSKFIVVFDAKEKSFRHQLYPEYKATRSKMPEALVQQLPYVQTIVKALGFPLLSVGGVEADDVLGSYAKEASRRGIKTVICTGDKDLSQVVDDNVMLYDSMKDVFYDAKAVKEKFGVGPELIIDYLTLKGDDSDNIPGMKGAGEKTAICLLNEIGGVEEILKHIDKIASLEFRGAKTFAPKYIDAIDKIRLSYKLATIKTDVELPLAIDEVPLPQENTAELVKVFTELEFTKLLEQAKKKLIEQGLTETGEKATEGSLEALFSQHDAAEVDFKSFGSVFHLITDIPSLDTLCLKIQKAKLVAIDTETTSLRPEECAIVGMSLSVSPKEGYYIPFNHTYLGVPNQLTVDEVKAKLQQVLNQDEVKIVGHNIKFDLLVLHYHGMDIKNVYADTMVLAHLLDSADPVNMDDLAKKYLGYKTITFKEVTGDKKKIPICEVPVERVCEYAGEDAEVTLRLFNTLFEKLNVSEKDKEIFFEKEMPFLKVLYQMELFGVYVDKEELERQNQNLKIELLDIQKQIYVSCGQEFNISSPKQLGKVLFEDMQIPYPKKVKDGKYSTAEEILEQISYDYDVANLVLRYRELSKLISTYTEKLQTLINPKTHRIYTSFNQAGTVTGRLSSSDPNLQNIPARTHEGKLIRKAFEAPEGYSLISADYSQIELRLIAHISQDPNLLKAFRAGYDVHKATAAEVLGKTIDEVTPQERAHAKATNFGLMYGMGAFGLRKQTHMSMSEAKVYIERYFARYPKVKDYMEQTKDFAHKHGYVTTIEGRKIAVANINSSNVLLLKGAERAAINAPMQGSAADVIKNAMIKLMDWIKSLPEDTVRMTVQVHDELLFEVKDSFIEEALKVIKDIMENAAQIDVPLEVGIGCSSNWADAH